MRVLKSVCRDPIHTETINGYNHVLKSVSGALNSLNNSENEFAEISEFISAKDVDKVMRQFRKIHVVMNSILIECREEISHR